MDNVEHLPHPVSPTPPEFSLSLHMVHAGAGHKAEPASCSAFCWSWKNLKQLIWKVFFLICATCKQLRQL